MSNQHIYTVEEIAMNFNMDRMNMLAGLEDGEKKLLNEWTTTLNESDEERIRAIIREELETALEVALAKREQKTFDGARESRSLAHAMKFANSTKFGGWKPPPSPGNTKPSGTSLGQVFGGVGFK